MFIIKFVDNFLSQFNPYKTKSITTLTDASVKRFIESGAEVLSPIERLLVAIWGLEADVNNGGFDQYYFNSYSDFAAETPSFLRAIGAEQAATLVEQANSQFGSEGPPTDWTKRREVLLDKIQNDSGQLWSELDKQFWTYPDDISTLLQAYIKRQ